MKIPKPKLDYLEERRDREDEQKIIFFKMEEGSWQDHEERREVLLYYLSYAKEISYWVELSGSTGGSI